MKRITITLTDEQHAMLRTDAFHANLPVAVYAVRKLFEDTVKHREVTFKRFESPTEAR